jgi:hypothetical protein
MTFIKDLYNIQSNALRSSSSNKYINIIDLITIQQNLALMQVKTILAYILFHYKIYRNADITFKTHITLLNRMVDENLVYFEKR